MRLQNWSSLKWDMGLENWERYDIIKDIGSGNFVVAKLVRDDCTNELFAVKFIERGHKIDERVQKEIMNH
ncbi:hypothetical protein VNO78_21732 [Psophocarpus tetragonolobus]|uniref:Protein kinase domain-containing protein n=1 Tax=Psophocarpus tetragonolobus TaxID=3891 RepID=A0AAN9XIA3_PSOTE